MRVKRVVAQLYLHLDPGPGVHHATIRSVSSSRVDPTARIVPIDNILITIERTPHT